MFVTRKFFLCFLVLLSLLSLRANAGIINPSFDDGLTGWTDLSTNGFVDASLRYAVLSGGDGFANFSASLGQGVDDAFNFISPIYIPSLAARLEFDLWLLNKVEDPSEAMNGTLGADYLDLYIYDIADPFFDLHFQNLAFDLGRVSLDISSIAGRHIVFSFDLFDVNDGYNIAVGLDNLQIFNRVASVGEPSVFFLFLLGLVALVCKFKLQPSR